MKCKQIEKMLIEYLDEKNFTEKGDLVQGHLKECSKCGAFAENLNIMKSSDYRHLNSSIPDRLVNVTLDLCHDELNRIKVSRQEEKSKQKQLPAFIWISIPVIIFLTVYWITSLLDAGIFNPLTSPQLMWGIIIIFQNIIMLLLAPILIRKFKTNVKQRNLILLNNV